MTRTPLKERSLPGYTRKEEIANMTTHIVGAGVGVIVFALSIWIAFVHQNVWSLVSGAVYGLSLILLYTVSSVYHGLIPSLGKKVMQVIDHCTIYTLIAGTYTPVCAMRPPAQLSPSGVDIAGGGMGHGGSGDGVFCHRP